MESKSENMESMLAHNDSPSAAKSHTVVYPGIAAQSKQKQQLVKVREGNDEKTFLQMAFNLSSSCTDFLHC